MEIQIQSLVIHAWAEIEHDIWYKSAFREMDEYSKRTQRLLDALNGHMMTAGLLLDQLEEQYQQRITQLKTSFEYTHELVAFLRKRVHKTYCGKGEEHHFSMLHLLLTVLQKGTEEAFQPIIDELNMKEEFTSNSELAHMLESYSFAPVKSVRSEFGIMAYILSKLSQDEESSARHRAERDNPNPPCYRLKVMLSSILWLLDLSDDDKKNNALKLCQSAGMSQEFIQSRAFTFLFDGALRTEILSRNSSVDKVDEEDRQSINDAWDWFEKQIDDKARGTQGRSERESIFAFLHRISRMGVLRELPKELQYVPLLVDDNPLSTWRGNGEDLYG